MCSSSEAGSYLRLIDFVYHSTLGLRAKKKKKERYPSEARPSTSQRLEGLQNAESPLRETGRGSNYFIEKCSGSEAGTYLRLIDFVYHSTLGLRVIKKRKMKVPVRSAPPPLPEARGPAKR